MLYNEKLIKLKQYFLQITRGPTGVRAQPLWADGSMVEDLVLDISSNDPTDLVNYRIMHCRSAPSPSATSSLPIGEVIVDKMFEKYPNLNIISK